MFSIVWADTGVCPYVGLHPQIILFVDKIIVFMIISFRLIPFSVLSCSINAARRVPTFCCFMWSARGMLLHAVEQAGELIEVAGIDVEVEHVAVAIEELVGWPAVDVQMTLNGGLLFVG